MLSRLYRYGQCPNSHDLLKTLAIILMVIDHLGVYVFPEHHWMRVIGRGAAPLFFFMVGCFPAKAPRAELLIYGVLLTVLTIFTDDAFYLNILLNFAFIKMVLLTLDDRDLTDVFLRRFVLGLILLNPFFYGYLEYSFSGILWALCARLFVNKDPRFANYLLIAALNHFTYEFLGLLPLQPFEKILYLGVVCTVFLMLLQYKIRVWQTPKGTRTFFMLMSRYSLGIYFWHLAGLKAWHYLSLHHYIGV